MLHVDTHTHNIECLCERGDWALAGSSGWGLAWGREVEGIDLLEICHHQLPQGLCSEGETVQTLDSPQLLSCALDTHVDSVLNTTAKSREIRLRYYSLFALTLPPEVGAGARGL